MKKAIEKSKAAVPMDPDTRRYIRRRRILGLVSLAVVIALFGWLTYFIMTKFLAFNNSPEEFKAFIDSYGWKGRFVALGIQVLQIVIALIPGELVEVGTGYAFGAVEGTLICMIGVAAASSLVFLLTRFLGVRLVEIFISREKIDELRFINSEEKLKRMIFLLFFIPGTPKDLLTYFAGLTRIKLHEFLYPEDSYVPSDEVKTYSQKIIEISGFGEEFRLDHSEDGSLAAYHESDTESADSAENSADPQEESQTDVTDDTQGYDDSSLEQ